MGPSVICEGNSTQLNPSTGGIWTVSNASIAYVSNSGLVNGLSSGVVSLVYTNSTTGCSIETPLDVTVNPKPVVTLPQSTLCKLQTTTLVPPTVGVWQSLNPTIASINASGLVSALGQGIARFTFTNTATGCVSNPSSALAINDLPNPVFTGPEEICIGMTTSLSPTSGGIWLSSNPAVSIIDNAGVVTGLSVGTSYLTFTDNSTGCTSDGTDMVSIIQGVVASVDGPSEICIGYQTQLFPATGGVWHSTDLGIALVDNTGKVIGVAPGKVSFTYTEISTGCMSSLDLDAVTVKPCLDPDFNVTTINKSIVGNVSTNDETNVGLIYGTSVISLQIPAGTIPTFSIQSNGMYQFSGSKEGEYLFRISVCVIGRPDDCNYSELSIKVVDPYNIYGHPVGNVDIATTYMNSNTTQGVPVDINGFLNDRCLKSSGCNLNTASLDVVTLPKYGIIDILADGRIEYISNPAFKGLDTLIYTACVDGDTTNCFVSKQIITTNALNALNSTVGADDFVFTSKNTPVNFNVKDNDSDPEGEVQNIFSMGTPASPIVISEGSYFLESNGNMLFFPATGFTGNVDIIYTICDNNGNPFCAKATVHILVLDDISLRIRVYLEGALIDNSNALSTNGRPLMRDNLRVNPITGQNNIPLQNPYKYPMQNFDISALFNNATATGNVNLYNQISDSLAVFSVEGQDAIVDWVYVELRSKSDYTQTLASRSGLLQRDGDIVDLDGISNLSFPGVNVDSFYVKVKHRSHLGVMSMKVASLQLIDFTSPTTPVFNFGTSLNNGVDYSGLSQNPNVKSGYHTLWAGDFNADGKLKFTNPSDDLNLLFFDVFIHPNNALGNANYNFAYGYYMGDINMNGKVKFDNPNDDKNLLYAQILFCPLNTDFLSNFNFFVEQVP
ncbi:MAG: hypothetical protein IPN29_18690 [Saprospiraceae bacterium]|nr:hypothetical protein [Saprospiraceae bacterium]